MRSRSQIVDSLEGVYREAYQKAELAGDAARMASLDLGFQRDQVLLEVLLDVRDALGGLSGGGSSDEPGLLDRAKAIRKFTKKLR